MIATPAVAQLAGRLTGLSAQGQLRVAVDAFPRRLAFVSSFGAEAAVLLHMVAQIDRSLPVIFLDTHRHFFQTDQYRRDLTEFLGLTGVRVIAPDPAEAAGEDPNADLWQRDPDACCALRKVRPLAGALAGFDAWVSGRKRYQGLSRATLPAVEADAARIKFNPLADWDKPMIDGYFEAYDLPRHPLVAQGFPSIGCHPCTAAVDPGGDSRDGRWSGRGKTECGIHSMAKA